MNILELGFGGGHLAYNLIKKGHTYKGIDVSSNLVRAAKSRCKNLRNRNFSFLCKSIDKKLKFPNNHFDVVIVCGVMQYATKPLFTFKEILRVLKKDSIFICAQSNFIVLRNFFNFRSLINRVYCLFANEEYEVSNSFRSLLLETKLKRNFKQSLKKKIIESKFCNKYFIKVNFKFKKRIIFPKKIISLGKKAGFNVTKIDSSGPFFNIGYKNKLALFVSKVLQSMTNIFFFSFLKKVNNSFIIIFKK